MERQRQTARRRLEQQTADRVDRVMHRAKLALDRGRKPGRRGPAATSKSNARVTGTGARRPNPRGAVRPGAQLAGAAAQSPPVQRVDGRQRSERARRSTAEAQARQQRAAATQRAATRQREAREIRARARQARREVSEDSDADLPQAASASQTAGAAGSADVAKPRAASLPGFENLRGGGSQYRGRESEGMGALKHRRKTGGSCE